MSQSIWVLGEALMDCVAQSDGSLRPLMGGSPFNMARAAALQGGYPVGPVCAAAAGLIPGRGGALPKPGKDAAPGASAGVYRDPLTPDLFA